MLFLLLAACAAEPPPYTSGALAECPPTPNCVRSEPGTDADHAVEPFPLGDPSTVRARLVALVERFPRTEIVVVRDDYLHATFTSRIWRFVDDVELRVDREAGVVHVRSASRVGRGDLGVNRARVEAMRAAWSAPDSR